MSVNQLIRGRSKTLSPEIRDLILSFSRYGISDLVAFFEEKLTTCHPKIFKTRSFRDRVSFDVCDRDGEPLWNIELKDIRFSRKTKRDRKITYCDCIMRNYSRAMRGLSLPLRPSHPCSKTNTLASEVSRVVLGIILLPTDYTLYFDDDGDNIPHWYRVEVMRAQNRCMRWEYEITPILDALKF